MSRFPRFLLGRLFLSGGDPRSRHLPARRDAPYLFLLGPFAPFGIASYAVYLGLGYSELKAQNEELPFSMGFFLSHLACVLTISLTDIAALHGFGFLAESMMAHLVLRALLLVGIAFLALACIPLETWVRTLRRTKLLWLYAMLAGALAWCLRFPMQSFWDISSSAPGRFLQTLTFHCVRAILVHFLPNIYVDPGSFVIGTERFSIFIAEACSGLEGLGLVLAFTTIWLWYFRKESRFPQALLLIPCALVCVWILNVLRISAIVLIGDAGYDEIAMVGFHSQAGWIAFTSVGFAFSMATRKLAWVRKIPDYAHSPQGRLDPETPFPALIVSGVAFFSYKSPSQSIPL